MIIAVLSGKGGAGKTFVSVNLASVVGPCRYLDCDVEEPNGALFLKPVDETVETVSVMMPVVDPKCCDGCRRCVDFCKFNALASSRGSCAFSRSFAMAVTAACWYAPMGH